MARFDLGIAAGFGLDALAEAGMLAGASLDMDFAGNRIYGASSFTSALAITRASTGYAENAAGVWSSFASGALRITDKGILIEEARTNSIRNNSMQGAVVGTPGTLPTNWSVTGHAGLTRTIIGIGTVNGVDYIDVRYSGTASGTFGRIIFDGPTAIAATSGQTWTLSCFLALVGGTISGTTNFYMLVNENTSGGVLVNEQSSIKVLTGSLQRYSSTFTLVGGGTVAALDGRIGFNMTSEQPVDFTLRIGWPQLELGAFATSPIRTTSAAATRAADIITVNSPTNYVSLAQGSSFVEWGELVGAAAATDRRMFNMRVDSSNSLSMNIVGGNAGLVVTNAGAVQASLYSSGPVVANNTYKMAVRWGTNNFAMRKSAGLGSDPANDTSGTPPLGAFVAGVGNGNSSVFLNGYIRRLAFFQSPQSDAALSAMVA